jgi:hypothetical protein
MKNLTQTLKYAVLGTVSVIALLAIWSFIEPYLLITKVVSSFRSIDGSRTYP